MQWEKADISKIDPHADYLVWTNAHEWRDVHQHVWRGHFVLNRMQPHIVRDRPVYVAKITDPREM
jgi:hypothetical protein